MKEEARPLLSVGRLQRPAEAWVTPRGAEEPAEEDEVYRHTARYEGLNTAESSPRPGQSSTGEWGIAAAAPHSLSGSLLSPTCSKGQEQLSCSPLRTASLALLLPSPPLPSHHFLVSLLCLLLFLRPEPLLQALPLWELSSRPGLSGNW